MPADAAIRDRLKAVREELSDKRSQRSTALKERDAAKEKFGAAEHEGKITDWPEFKDAEHATAAVGRIDDDIADLKLSEGGLVKMLGDFVADNGPAAIGNDGNNGNAKLAELYVGRWDARKVIGPGSEYAHAIERGRFSSSARFGTIDMGEIASRDDALRIMADLPSTPAGVITSPSVDMMITPDSKGLQPYFLRPLTFLDLIPTGPTASNSIEYVQITGIPGGSDMVAEGAVKPQLGGPTFTDATAPIRTVAGWIKVNRQAMDDAPGIGTMINSLLPYDVRRKIESQVLNGDGTGQNLLGLLNQVGIAKVNLVAGDNPADRMLRLMTTVILSDGVPNFAALHPIDWQDILLMRETGTGATRSGQYLGGGPFGSTAQSMWGLALTPTTTIAQNTPLVGDSRATTLFVREGVNVKASDSDQDDFVRNRVTILAEARVGLVVWKPSSFATPSGS
jgi:hypothetical protein